MNLDEARQVLIEHSRSSKNGKFPEYFHFQQTMTNPICGDHVEIRIFTLDDKIQEIGFLAKGCAICSASASMMSQNLKGQTLESGLELSNLFENSILETQEKIWPEALNAFRSFEHLRVNLGRRACALLPWVTLRSAFKNVNKSEPASKDFSI